MTKTLDVYLEDSFVGNHDAHGKNFSLIYHLRNPTKRLAPLYDVLSTVYYPELSKKMAMKIGGSIPLTRYSQSILREWQKKRALPNL
jgi:serine/threonine-protein kinase HipA